MGRPTIAHLAKAANVSVSTIDRVMNGRDPVRPETAEQVLLAAERIGFRGITAIRRRLESNRPVRKFGFLLKQSHRKLYQMWAETLAKAVEEFPHAHGRSLIRFSDELEPEKVAETLFSLSREVDAIALIASDHPKVNHAVDQVVADGVPVFTMIADLSAPGRTGYVGNDNFKKGRTAAWFVANTSRTAGKVAVFVGSHRYLCQDLCEMGFRSYLREQGLEFQMMETMLTHEEPKNAYDLIQQLLTTTPDLVGLYVAGGGITGVMRALRENDTPAVKKLIVVGHELTNDTRTGLADGVVKAILSHPARVLTDTLVNAMAEAVNAGPSSTVAQHILPFEIYTAENI